LIGTAILLAFRASSLVTAFAYGLVGYGPVAVGSRHQIAGGVPLIHGAE
jgi:hypothetical protein